MQRQINSSRIILFFVYATFVMSIPWSSVRADPINTPPEKLKVGMLLTLSGKFASAGEDCKIGIEAALAIIGKGSRLEVIYADSMNDPAASVSEFRKLMTSDKVLAIYTHRSSVGMALNSISLSTGIPLLGAVAHEDFATNNKYAFQIAWRTDEEGRFVANRFMKRGYKRAALLSTEDEYTSAVANSFREEFAKLGGFVIYDQSINPSETDFRTLLLQVKSKGVDVVYLDLLLPHIVPIVKQARELGLDTPLFGNFYIAKEEVREALGVGTLEGVQFVDVDNDLPTLKAHLAGGRAVNPPGLTVLSYVATLILAQAIQSNPDIRSAEELYAALAAQYEVRTPDRVFRVNDRMVQFPLIAKVLQGGKIVKD